jgi:hypothetical protein
MRQLFLILCLPVIFNILLMGQEKSAEDIQKDILYCLVEMGTDTTSTLNVCESKYLNFNYQKDKGTFDFCGKRVVFFRGNAGTIKSTKREYFNGLKQFVHQNSFLPSSSGQLIIFNEDEAKQTGYDAVIISLSKKYLTKKDILRQLKKKY